MANLQLENDDSQQKEAGNAPAVEPSKGPQYPSGLTLYLDSDTVDKLGLEGCEVGSAYDIAAKGKVISISENDNEGQEYSKTVTIQITDMAADEVAGEKDNLLGQDKNDTTSLDKLASRISDSFERSKPKPKKY